MNQVLMLTMVCAAILFSAPIKANVTDPEKGRQVSSRRQMEEDERDRDRNRNKPSRSLAFNIFCRFENEGTQPPRKCYAGAQFVKLVTERGNEIEDNSEYPYNPVFEVECDGEMILNDPSRRFTDRVGTRIQAQAGPYPAIVMPVNTLRDGRRRVKSSLELRDTTLQGLCYVYTGNP